MLLLFEPRGTIDIVLRNENKELFQRNRKLDSVYVSPVDSADHTRTIVTEVRKHANGHPKLSVHLT